METYRHDEATCPRCLAALYYGTKAEPSCWKVYYLCSDCDWEAMAGRVDRAAISHQDELWERAENLGERWVNSA
ncbi:hypothetical protein [Haloarchaeobius baliensis]|uniref:hypothetical protein n=1 Tax=Haloarchaeobius baliensis TaxID=1670458 RepID=UPI003F8835F4